MIEIKDLLSRFDHLLKTGEFKIESIREAILRATGLEINPTDIEIKGGTVFLNIKPIYKNEIFLKRELIDSILQEKLKDRAPRDLR